MKFCGCLTVEKDSRDENPTKYVKRYFLKRDLQKNNMGGSALGVKSQKDRTKRNATMDTASTAAKNTSKIQFSSESIDKVVLRDSRHDTSKRRSVTFANDSETEQRKFLRLNKIKRGSIDELQFNGSKRANRSSPNVNDFTPTLNTSYETTTGDELDNSQQKKTVVRRRKRSKSPRKQLPSELLDAIKFDLVESVGLDENQLKVIPYENVKTSSQPMRISISSYTSRQHQRRRRCSSPFNRGVVHSVSSQVLHYQAQPTVVCVAQVKSTKILNLTKKTDNST
ncbi:unnamed protein product [Adineta ricciae]|uniref:Uncharacterized protein n=1 Tax=Adineta ricciae TaxID=249248 RepID=A0A814ABM3_ADIRI|nr:unnamed protein product [Adineta ricciae]